MAWLTLLHMNPTPKHLTSPNAWIGLNRVLLCGGTYNSLFTTSASECFNHMKSYVILRFHLPLEIFLFLLLPRSSTSWSSYFLSFFNRMKSYVILRFPFPLEIFLFLLPWSSSTSWSSHLFSYFNLFYYLLLKYVSKIRFLNFSIFTFENSHKHNYISKIQKYTIQPTTIPYISVFDSVIGSPASVQVA